MFRDRKAAGKALAEALQAYAGDRPVILALPRGGVPVGREVADALGAPLDVLIVRKVGAPQNPEVAMAAVVDGSPPECVVNEAVFRMAAPGADLFDRLVKAEEAELARRRVAYCGDAAPVEVAGRTVILVDDGIATGTTMKAALKGLRRRNPARIVLAVPVAPADVLAELGDDADAVVCLESPDPFMAVGAHYRSFPQLRDSEVIAALARDDGAKQS